MRREVHVRFRERLAVTFRGPTLPTYLSQRKKAKLFEEQVRSQQ